MTTLTKEQEGYFDDLNETFRTVGWEKHIMEDAFQRYEANSKLLNERPLTEQQMHELRGAQTVLKSFLDYEKLAQTIRQGIEQENELSKIDEEELNAEAII